MVETMLLGLDAASQYENFGYAIGLFNGKRLTVEHAGILAAKKRDFVETVLAKQLGRCSRALVAIDAPLGWPKYLGAALDSHHAGNAISIEKNVLFRRRTDIKIREICGKTPLEVGADKIARASHTALQVLARLRTATGLQLPLVWNTNQLGAGVVEVYPAATLRQHGAADSGYKDKDSAVARGKIAGHLERDIPDLEKYVGAKADVFDACLCLLAGADFLRGHCVAPSGSELADAKKEGWIWVTSAEG